MAERPGRHPLAQVTGLARPEPAQPRGEAQIRGTSPLRNSHSVVRKHPTNSPGGTFYKMPSGAVRKYQGQRRRGGQGAATEQRAAAHVVWGLDRRAQRRPRGDACLVPDGSQPEPLAASCTVSGSAASSRFTSVLVLQLFWKPEVISS